MQPGGRAPAPGDLALVQAFINSHYDLEIDHGADLLASACGASEWLARYGLIGSSGKLRRDEHAKLLASREALRALARGERQHPGEIEVLAHGAPVHVALTDHGPNWQRLPGEGVDGALGLIFAIAGRAMLEGTWNRLKVCPGEDCGWAFYDHSRNQTGRWCSMSVCGGRAKARTHYRRRRAHP